MSHRLVEKTPAPRGAGGGVQGYLAHKKMPSPWDRTVGYAQGPRGVLGGWAVSYERGTPAHLISSRIGKRAGGGVRSPPFGRQGASSGVSLTWRCGHA